MSKTLPTYESIWDTLNSLDVSHLVRNKNDCMYLQWMKAWSMLMKFYPEATYHFGENKSEPDGTMTVSCAVTIGGAKREMFLPVMTGFRSIAKPHPDARQIGDSKMRCLVKCLAMFGLGASLYYGELCAPESGTEVEHKPEQPKPFENKGLTHHGSTSVPVEQQVEQQTAMLQSPISKTVAYEAGKYAFVNLYEFEQWVISKKGMRFEDLGHDSRERMIEFFGKFTSRNDWPIF